MVTMKVNVKIKHGRMVSLMLILAYRALSRIPGCAHLAFWLLAKFLVRVEVVNG